MTCEVLGTNSRLIEYWVFYYDKIDNRKQLNVIRGFVNCSSNLIYTFHWKVIQSSYLF